MSTTPTESQHGGHFDTQPTTPRAPPPRKTSEPSPQKTDPETHGNLRDMEQPSGSAPLGTVKSVAQHEAFVATRATSEPVRMDLTTLQLNGRDSPGTPSQLPDFDWEDFEARYERALENADEHERAILKEAETLSKYFRAWASAASVQDNERAVKRLQTRQRFVNLSEEKMAQKQQHYEEVVKAFESALALLRSHA